MFHTETVLVLEDIVGYVFSETAWDDLD